MTELFDTLGRNFGVFVLLLVAAGLLVGAVLRTVTTIVVTGARERSRREIAAYIAEGSVSPDQGERLLRAEVDGSPGEKV